MFYNTEFLDRFSRMLDAEKLNKLLSARVLVFGVGGVGSALINMLVRSGIHNIGIVDFDKIDLTNVNRQLVANTNNVGKSKVQEMQKQIKQINAHCIVKTYEIKFSEETKGEIDFENYDYVLDCIDDLSAKKLIIKTCKEKNIPLLCAMGAGNRYNEIPQFEISDISKTCYDPIAKILRKFCASERINKLNVCYTKQKALKFDCKIIGSVIYYPVNMASVMCAKIINDIIT